MATATGETANLVVRVGTHIRFVYSAEGHRLLRIGDRRGHVMDAGISAAGQILLLDCAEDELRDLYLDPSTRTRDRQNSTPVTPPLTDVEFSELLTRLAAVRRSDFAVNLERTEHGVAAFGAAIRTPQGRILAAATLTMPTVRYRENLHDGTLSKLITAARAISTDLAGFGEVQ
nr:IclR family transcriptional regulator C-terminal domain-containing protein [Tsukamurella paurometabola]